MGIGGGRGLDGTRGSRCAAVMANLSTPVELGLGFHGDLLAGRVGIAAQLRLMIVTRQA
jgi:predicted NBD/HSP70 family sugar kinase